MQNLPTDRAGRITAILTADFAPIALDVIDDSARHAGHSGATAAGQTHFNVNLVSAAFRGQGKVARHRAVYAALANEFSSGLHAIALTLRSPEEAARENLTGNLSEI